MKRPAKRPLAWLIPPCWAACPSAPEGMTVRELVCVPTLGAVAPRAAELSA